ncbi:hypothetical protein R3P38DRAFT_3379648 [Favolaschia claudopus]|uniref:Uncharacterized protein n=1 Tax=Favolaschia claudopus TaxID=2862362 RepID=A0AAV9Z5S1_9AGAR
MANVRGEKMSAREWGSDPRRREDEGARGAWHEGGCGVGYGCAISSSSSSFLPTDPVFVPTISPSRSPILMCHPRPHQSPPHNLSSSISPCTIRIRCTSRYARDDMASRRWTEQQQPIAMTCCAGWGRRGSEVGGVYGGGVCGGSERVFRASANGALPAGRLRADDGTGERDVEVQGERIGMGGDADCRIEGNAIVEGLMTLTVRRRRGTKLSSSETENERVASGGEGAKGEAVTMYTPARRSLFIAVTGIGRVGFLEADGGGFDKSARNC